MKTLNKGFSLIELLVALVIIGILASIAIPSYQSYVIKGKRSEAKATVLNLAQMEERYYTNNYQYYPVSAVPPTAEPQGWKNFVGNSMSARTYDIAVSAVSPTTAFAITATPSNGLLDAECGALSLDNKGNKGSNKGGVSPCW
jgi:type IV pilus assembly protein PilE